MPRLGSFRISELVDQVDQRMSAVERAKQLGTYNADDRSNQYPLDDRAQLHKAVNECWTKVHLCEKQLKTKDAQIAVLKGDLRSNWLWTKIVGAAAAVAWGLVLVLLEKCVR